jgi:hypothetical protein
MRATQILLYMVPPRRRFQPPPADMSREAVKRLHIDGTAYWVLMDTIKPPKRPERKS